MKEKAFALCCHQRHRDAARFAHRQHRRRHRASLRVSARKTRRKLPAFTDVYRYEDSASSLAFYTDQEGTITEIHLIENLF